MQLEMMQKQHISERLKPENTSFLHDLMCHLKAAPEQTYLKSCFIKLKLVFQ